MNNETKTPPVLGTQPGDVIKWADIDHNTQRNGLYPAQFRAAAAEWYATQGLEVGPMVHEKCREKAGKAPRSCFTPRGFYDFTADVETVRAWWKQMPNLNVGIRPPAGYVVIDVDVKNGAPGAQTWRNLTAGRTVPETLTMITGSGGWHFWFRLPYEANLRGKLMHLDSGIDLKHNGGCLVAAPSVHPDPPHGLYQLHSWMKLDDVPVLPVWLYSHVYAPEVKPQNRRKFANANPDKRIAGLVNFVDEAKKGERNDSLFWAACRNAEYGLGIDEELVEAAIRVGLSESKARATVASGNNKYPSGGGLIIE